MRKTSYYGLLATAMLLSVPCLAKNDIPLVYDVEFTGSEYEMPVLPTLEESPIINTLPNPFEFSNGKGSVKKFKDWSRRRSEIVRELQHYELGDKPAVSKDDIDVSFEGNILKVIVKANGQSLTLTSNIKFPKGDGPFPAVIGMGGGTGSLPAEIFDQRGIAQISFNFSQVMSHTQNRGSEPINKLYPDLIEMGSYSAWPWGVSRIIDALEILGPEITKIDTKHLAVSGCSFAGKMALYAGSFDERIALTIAQEPGGGGADSWRVSETLGNVETLGRTNYQWFLESMRRFSEKNVSKLPIDHHQLAALVAPRALLVLGNTDYEWLADESNYVSCHAARKVWEAFGIADRMGFSIEGGHMHCQLPKSQYPEVEAFVDKFLLGKKDVDTNVMKAEKFKDVDYNKWMPWAK